MTDSLARARQWVDVLQRGAFDEWDNFLAEDMVMHALAMPGHSGPVIGRDANRARVAELWQAWRHYAFHDVDVHAAADDPNLVFVFCRAQAESTRGTPYANHYAFRLRFQDGLIIEQIELFDSAPVTEVFKDYLPL